MKDIATTSISVFQNLDCLSLVVCSDTILLKFQIVLFLLYSRFCSSKSGVRLIYGCGVYTDVYGALCTQKYIIVWFDSAGEAKENLRSFKTNLKGFLSKHADMGHTWANLLGAIHRFHLGLSFPY